MYDMYVCDGVIVRFFFFKQKTAYEVRISDWSSDVCSSDLGQGLGLRHGPRLVARGEEGLRHRQPLEEVRTRLRESVTVDYQVVRDNFVWPDHEIGRASWRERVCQYV